MEKKTRIKLSDLRAARTKSKATLSTILDMLRQLDVLCPPPSERCWVYFHPSKTTVMAKELRKELMKHALGQSEEIRRLWKEERVLRRRNRLEKAMKDHKEAMAVMNGKLVEAAADGVLSDEEALEIIAVGKGFMKNVRGLIRSDPNPKVIQAGLEVYANCLALGASSDSGFWKEAFGDIQFGVDKLHTNAIRGFRQTAKTANMKRVLAARALSQSLGNETRAREPGGPPLAGNVRHVVQPGESLSGLSKEYYGRFGFWDRILFANPGYFQNGVQLHPGMDLTIP